MRRPLDKQFLGITATLVVVGFFSFTSASLGLLARDGATFSSVAFNQIVFGVILGGIALLIASRFPYRFLRRYAFFIFLASIAATLLVFVPNLGLSFGGARRWVDLGFISFQPAELLKLGFVIYFAAWLSGIRDKAQTFTQGTLPLVILLTITGAIMLLQPDTGTFLVMVSAGIAMLVAAGGRFSHLAGLGATAIGLVGILAYLRPYVRDRILTFLDPAGDPLGAGYQIQQSLISIGSGETFGRGFGQSIQKFNFLPEPIGDSIFAVISEEFGFIGATLIITLFIFFVFRGLKIAARSADRFGGLLVVGIVILIASQSFINIGSMLGVMPLTGLPLVFISHGGTALFLALLEVGIILSVSRHSSV